MHRRSYSDQQRDLALAAYREFGPAEASRRCAVPAPTIASWARRAGVQTDAPETTRAAVAVAAGTWRLRRIEEANALAPVIASIREALSDAVARRDSRKVSSFATAYERLVRAAEGITASGQIDEDLPASQRELEAIVAARIAQVERERYGSQAERIAKAHLVIDRIVARRSLAGQPRLDDRAETRHSNGATNGSAQCETTSTDWVPLTDASGEDE